MITKLRHIIRKEIKNLSEAYADVGIDYAKNKLRKLGEYRRYDDKLKGRDFTLLHFKTENDPEFYLWGDVKAFDNTDGTEVGNVSYGKEFKGDRLKASVDVRPDMRRRGIATQMYKWIEKLTGDRLVPDTPHTKDAAAFWKTFGKRK